MRRLSTGLLAQIEAGALDSKTSLADTARKCVALGGHSGSAELRDWARQELNGYKGESIPAYRVVPAILAVDGHNFAHRITGQQISTSDLPEFARETLEPEVPLTSGVAELEVLAAKPGTLQIQHPGMASLVSYMNSTNDSGYAITSLYWKVGTSHVHGVVDTIRTMLVALVAELRASGIGEGPSAEAVDQAIKVIVHGAERSTININTNPVSAASGDVAVHQSTTHEVVRDAPSSRIPDWVKGPWGFLVGAPGLISAAVAIAAWIGWNPFN